MAQQYEDDFETNSSSSGKKVPQAAPAVATVPQQQQQPTHAYVPAAVSVPIPYAPSSQGPIPYSSGGGVPPPLGYTQPNVAQSYAPLQGAGPLSSFTPLGHAPWVPPSTQPQPSQLQQSTLPYPPQQVSSGSVATAAPTGGSGIPVWSQLPSTGMPPPQPSYQPWHPTASAAPLVAAAPPYVPAVPAAGMPTQFPPPLGAVMPTYPGQGTMMPTHPLSTQQPPAGTTTAATALPAVTTTPGSGYTAVPSAAQAPPHGVAGAEAVCTIPQLASEAAVATAPSQLQPPPPPSAAVAATAPPPPTADSLRLFACSGDARAVLTHFTFAGVEIRRRPATAGSPKRDGRATAAPTSKSSRQPAQGSAVSPVRKSFVTSELRIWRAFRNSPAATGASVQPQSSALVVTTPPSSRVPTVDLHSVARTYDDQHGGLSAAFVAGDLFSIAYSGTPDQINKHIADFKESLPSHLTVEEKADRLKRLLDSEGHVSYHKRLLGIKKVRAQSTLGLGSKATALQFAVVSGRLDNVLTLARMKCGRRNIDAARALAKQNGFSAIEALLNELHPQKRKHLMTTTTTTKANVSTKGKSELAAADP